MRTKRSTFLALAGAVVSLVVAPQASAQTSAWFVGADGGDATLSRAGSGYTLEGCDTERDGHGAIAQIFNVSGKEVVRARDVGGADNGCAVTRGISPRTIGRDIKFRITVKDHNGSEGPIGAVKDEKLRFIRLF
jgi:hypothetical protein